MARIHILGGTGYAGAHIAREGAARGHDVVSFSRSLPAEQTAGVTYRLGDARDDAFLSSAFDGADIVISSLSPHGALEPSGALRAVLRNAARLAAERDIRFGVVGGAGSLLAAPDGPRLLDTPEFPDLARAEAAELAGGLDDLRAVEDERLDWFLVSPAQIFGSFAPGEATGRYRIGGDVVLRDDDGRSALSGADLALAVIDEVERPAHHRTRFTVAY